MRFLRIAMLACAVPLAGGCYQYSRYPLERPAPQQTVEVTLNDRGRMAMERNVGTDVVTIEGSVATVSDSGFVLRVQRVTTFDGAITRWAGEQVTFENGNVRMMRARQFSAGRTVLLAGSVAAGTVGMFATGIVGRALGERTGPSNGGDPGNQGQ